MEHDEVVMMVRGTPVRAYRGGHGAPIVLLHGGGLDSALLSWQPAWDSLTRLGRVMAVDLPGFGASPLGTTSPTLRGYADWLVEFLDAAAIPSAVLVGVSLGGGIAIQAALRRPDRVDGLILCAPYGLSPRSPGGRAGWLAVHTPGLSRLTYAGLRRSDSLLRRGLGALVASPSVIDEHVVHQVHDLLSAKRAGVAWSRFQHSEVGWGGPRTYWRTELSAISVPVALLSGTEDTLVPSSDLRAAAQRLPQAKFISVPGAGHWLPRETPDKVTAAVASMVTTEGRLP
jgi:pimeloyl-ACP methyl ester carboxylesterase